MSVNRDELFKKAADIHKKQKKEREDKKNFKYDVIDYNPLEKDKIKVFRLLGVPPETSVGKEDPFSPKFFHVSMILGDNDKKIRIIWPDKKDCDTWILWKIYDLIKDCTWVGGDPIYKYKDTHPTLFNRVHKNNNINNQFERGWFPKKMVGFNHFDRDKMSWHQENKKSLILCRKASERRDGSYFYEVGIPYFNCYERIVEDIQIINGDWENYDIGIEAVEKDPFYRVFHIEDDWKKLSKRDDRFNSDSHYFKFMNRPLTDEELSWERWDLNKLFKISSYQKIKRGLGKFIELVDEVFNKHYSEELNELVEKEKKEYEKNSENKIEENMNYIDKREEEEKKVQVVKEKELEKSNIRPLSKKSIKEQLEELRNKKLEGNSRETDDQPSEKYIRFIGIDKLTDEETNYIIKIKADPVEFIYNPDADKVYECDYCIFESPIFFKHCPDCGKEFDD